jgi:hypothetical protein
MALEQLQCKQKRGMLPLFSVQEMAKSPGGSEPVDRRLQLLHRRRQPLTFQHDQHFLSRKDR